MPERGETSKDDANKHDEDPETVDMALAMALSREEYYDEDKDLMQALALSLT